MSIVDRFPLTSTATLGAAVLTLGLSAVAAEARGKYNVKAPNITGHVEFEKRSRAHMNTLESLVIFLPILWLLAIGSSSDLVPGILGLVWVVGRLFYSIGYISEPSRRLPAFFTVTTAQVLVYLGAAVFIGKSLTNVYFN
jgi:glutathione S-transferase